MATKTAKKTTASKTSKGAKAATKKAAPKKAPAKSKPEQRTGDAPRSELDLEETKKLEAVRAKKKKAKPEGDKKLSAIDAAAQVLAAAKEPMNAKEMIDAMAAQDLWTSPGGKTPHATLYSAILREVATKGKEARFVKTERGKFSANG